MTQSIALTFGRAAALAIVVLLPPEPAAGQNLSFDFCRTVKPHARVELSASKPNVESVSAGGTYFPGSCYRYVVDVDITSQPAGASAQFVVGGGSNVRPATRSACESLAQLVTIYVFSGPQTGFSQIVNRVSHGEWGTNPLQPPDRPPICRFPTTIISSLWPTGYTKNYRVAVGVKFSDQWQAARVFAH